jgi:excisionase family DNA binding protein
MNTAPRFVTTTQAAAMLSIAVDKVLDWVHTGQLAAVDVSTHRGGRPRWRISLVDLESFLATRRTSPIPEPARRKRGGFHRKYYL